MTTDPITGLTLSFRTQRLREAHVAHHFKKWMQNRTQHGPKIHRVLAVLAEGNDFGEYFFRSRVNTSFPLYYAKLMDNLHTAYTRAKQDVETNPSSITYTTFSSSLQALAQAGRPEYARRSYTGITKSQLRLSLASTGGDGIASYRLAEINLKNGNLPMARKYLIRASAFRNPLASWDLAKAYANPAESNGLITTRPNIVLALWYANKVLTDLPKDKEVHAPLKCEAQAMIDDLMPAAKRQGLNHRHPNVFKAVRNRVLLGLIT